MHIQSPVSLDECGTNKISEEWLKGKQTLQYAAQPRPPIYNPGLRTYTRAIKSVCHSPLSSAPVHNMLNRIPTEILDSIFTALFGFGPAYRRRTAFYSLALVCHALHLLPVDGCIAKSGLRTIGPPLRITEMACLAFSGFLSSCEL